MKTSSPATTARDEFCTVDRPIRWRREDMVIRDDNATMLRIKEHNAVFSKLCLTDVAK